MEYGDFFFFLVILPFTLPGELCLCDLLYSKY